MEKSNTYWTIKELFEKHNSIEFPEYQREPTVWSLEKKQRLIDSILRGIDIASIYLFKKEDNSYDCIDGRQRINAILSYLNKNPTDTEDNGFHVTIVNEIFTDTGQIQEANDKRFVNLTRQFQDRIWNYRISVVIIESVDNEDELNLFFLRLNLGQILNAGERLHAMIGDMREFIFNDIGLHEYPYKIQLPSPDFKVDIKDIAYAAKAFGSHPGHERWSPFADISCDYKIDIRDIAMIASKFGWSG